MTLALRSRRRRALLTAALAASALLPLAACVSILGDFNSGDGGAGEGGVPDTGPRPDGGGDSHATEAGPETGPVSDAGLSVSPSTLAFGDVAYGQSSAAMALTVTNSGASATGALTATLGGANAGDFAQDAGGCTTLAPGAKCSISVTFTPTDAGARAATLSVAATPGGTVAAQLTGTGDSVYSTFSDISKWTVFDMSALNSNAVGCRTSAFDGRFVYFVGESSVLARYDTQGGPFTQASSWSVFDMSTISSLAAGYSGAAFDGRYIYLVPNRAGSATGGPGGLVMRFDTTGAFTAATSWSTFNVAANQPSAAGYTGAAFDGRFLYLVPNDTTNGTALVARYDTQATFTTATSWSTFDISTLAAGNTGFEGAVYDGRYVYFVPEYAGGLISRYDTQAGFATAASWTTFNPQSVNADASGFAGGGFDGRYVYFAPYNSSVGTTLRYDTTLPFTTVSSWSTFALANVTDAGANGYAGTGFDGRYLYLVPNFGILGELNGLLARYDTTAAFDVASSWSIYNVTNVNTQASGFWGAAFDGRYLYLVPDDNGGDDGIVARFDAKQPPGQPASYFGSFF